MTTVIPTTELNKMKRTLQRIDNMLSAQEMINEEEACKLLGITKRTIGNYVSNGNITKDMYTVGVGGNRFYYKQKLIGL